MHPVLVADIERKVYPLDQGHIAADGVDIEIVSGGMGNTMGNNRGKRPRVTYARSWRYGRPSETTARKLVPCACFPHRSRGHIF